jgi:hypothetical protein
VLEDFSGASSGWNRTFSNLHFFASHISIPRTTLLHGVVRRGGLRRLSARENASLGLEHFSTAHQRNADEA